MTDEIPIEEQLLASKPFDPEAAAEQSIEAKAVDLVEQIMHQLRGEYGLQYSIDGLTDTQKADIHSKLCRIAAAAMRGTPLPEIVRPEPPANISGQPLEPEPEGEVFQFDGLLISQQVKP